MKTTARKPRLTVSQLHAEAARIVSRGHLGNPRPSHCDVRCVCNDLLDLYSRGGYTVPHHYSQDKAHREVLRALRN